MHVKILLQFWDLMNLVCGTFIGVLGVLYEERRRGGRVFS